MVGTVPTPAPRSTRPGALERLRAPLPPPTRLERALRWAYVLIALLLLTSMVRYGPRSRDWYPWWFFGGGSLYAGFFAWSAWGLRARAEDGRPRARALNPLIVHAALGLASSALFAFDLQDTRELQDVSVPVLGWTFAAVILGWLPGLLLRNCSERAGALTAAGFFGLVWLAPVLLGA